MPRSARIVVPGLAHHVTQRGNRQQTIFFDDKDRQSYKTLLADACIRHNVRCLVWCLMSNHVHLILVPSTTDGLRACLASTHTSYTQRLNLRMGLSGHVFQGRFASYPMDDAHLMVAARYVENNPVKAGLVAAAENWPWSSARANISGRSDGLADAGWMHAHYPNWESVLSKGLEAHIDEDEQISCSIRSGAPLGAREWAERILFDAGLNVPKTTRGRPKKGTVPF